jgi:MtN3 and saliva related transmembrane protein
MNWVSLLGYLAACCTTIAYLPQAIKVIKTKQTKDLSLLMYLVVTTGLFLWFAYGIFIRDWPMILANGITMLFTLSILILKINYR